MTWKDKLEIGLKDDAPFRRDNLPDFQRADDGVVPDEQEQQEERSPEEPGARAEAARESLVVKQHRRHRAVKRTGRTGKVS